MTCKYDQGKQLHCQPDLQDQATVLLQASRPHGKSPALTACLHSISLAQAFLQAAAPQSFTLRAASDSHDGLAGCARGSNTSSAAAMGVLRTAAVEYPSVSWHAVTADNDNARLSAQSEVSVLYNRHIRSHHSHGLLEPI